MTSREVRKWAKLSKAERDERLSLSVAKAAEAHRTMGEAARRAEQAFLAWHGIVSAGERDHWDRGEIDD